MNVQPNYNRFPGPGDLPGDSSNPNSPDFNPPETVLNCPNETGTWLADNMADEVETAAIEAIGDFLTSFRDGYAKEKLLRQMLELADLCERSIQADEMGRAS